jgi:hypothetical protein
MDAMLFNQCEIQEGEKPSSSGLWQPQEEEEQPWNGFKNSRQLQLFVKCTFLFGRYNFFFFLSVLEFELRASHLLGR